MIHYRERRTNLKYKMLSFKNKINSLLRQKHNNIVQLLVSHYGNMFRSFFRPSSGQRSLVVKF